MSKIDLSYTVLLGQNENGSWTACVPALNWLADDGPTIDAAIEQVKQAMMGYFSCLIESGIPIPVSDPPGPLVAPWEDLEPQTVSHTRRISQVFHLETAVA